MPAAEVYAHRIAHHGEGAVWWPEGFLRTVDAYAGELVDVLPDLTLRRTQVGGFAGCVRPRAGGGAVLGVDRGAALQDVDGSVHPFDPVMARDVRVNDGSCDPQGNFWFGSMAWDGREGAGTLYRLDAGGAISVQLQDASICNGLGWSPDGSTVYWNDTPTQTVWTFSYDGDAGLVDRRPFVRIDPDDGAPDGLTVDRDGGIWVAMWQGGAVRHYDRDGRLDEVVDVDASQVTSCSIGGDQLDQLYITTSREDLADDADPLAGSVFVLDLGASLGSHALPYSG